MMLASTMVDSLCATMRVVRELRRLCNADWILRSVRVSCAYISVQTVHVDECAHVLRLCHSLKQKQFAAQSVPA